jgi:cell division protein ZapA
MKQVEVTILGQSYLLACPEGGEALLHAAVAAVDREMSAIRDAGKVKARERIAVLAALNLAYKLAETPRGAPAEPAPPAETGTHVPHSEASVARRAAAAQVDMLIARLDTALNEDGRLL